MSRIAAGYGKAYRLEIGDRIEIATVAGSQVADAWALASQDPFEYLSMDHTRSVNSNIFVTRGTRLVSNHRRSMLQVEEDSSESLHDTLLCPCNSAIYRELGVEGYHRSCTDNFHEALAELNIVLPFTPASLNLFMSVPVAPDGAVDRLPPKAKAGDAVILRAEMRLVLILSACPQDITPINGFDRKPTDLHVRVRPAARPEKGV